MLYKSIVHKFHFAALAAFFLLFSSVSQATGVSQGGLDLTQLNPDIYVNNISITYDAGAGAFVASGVASAIKRDSGNTDISGSFSLTAAIDNSGVASVGNLTVSDGSSALLQGSLTAFDQRSGEGLLNFLFAVTGGSLQSEFSPVVGVILSDSSLAGGFASSFNNLIINIPGTGTGVADVTSVPLPAAAWLFGTGLVGLIGSARRKLAVES